MNMATTVLISDFPSNKHYHLVFTDLEFHVIELNWYKQDKLLVELSHTTHLFKGRTKWCDLDALHYQILITKNISKLDELSDEEQMNENHEVIKSLHFLITGFIKTISTKTHSNVDLIRIDRISENSVNLTYTCSQCVQLDNKKNKKGKDVFKIVVDNTKKE
jgi:hypothetical protein